ncbi:uncharacterized protein LOC119431222 isoform X18 [Dermacentor silvarum]|uniref:uncharacterized protein LOC119431222 isoform X18 n=1 Tax=Dermacentor silvarum TaxID=543639 RepID=UPI002100D2EF|nr:uncharacterized protein LOC119431222 isoform X18 [Dermacentor silvarum]
MPDHGTGRVHRFRDHVVAGVNWRPTRFVDEVPNSRVCGLCRMIPKQTVLLPCSHALCQSCHAASFEGGVGHCPLDREPFEEAECFGYQFPTRKANTLKVHCWNEAHGCEYTDTMDRMLEHYEKECTFHSVECLRCGVVVHHSDLQMHYVAGCIAGGSSAIAEYPSSNHTALTLEDVSAALEDLKTMLGDPNHDQLLPVIQSQLNELTEQVRNQEARFAEITRELKSSEQNLKKQIDQIAGVIVSTEHGSRQNQEPEAFPSSTLSLPLEKLLIVPKLSSFAHMSLDTLEYLRLNATLQGQDLLITSCEPDVDFLRHVWITTGEKLAGVSYQLTLKNANEIFTCNKKDRKFANVTVWHARDMYFTFVVWKVPDGEIFYLVVDIAFHGLLASSQTDLRDWRVNLRHTRHNRFLDGPFPGICVCARNHNILKHIHQAFTLNLDLLKKDGFRLDGNITFEIRLPDVALQGAD